MADVIVSGAGAAGLCAAIHAARKGASVLVIEKTDAAGKKLSMTGNGRCNLSNKEMGPSMYNASAQEEIRAYLQRFSVNETISFMESIGVNVTDEDGYLYPLSSQATSVTEALFAECERLRVSFVFHEQIKSILCPEFFIVRTANNAYEAPAVIVCTGGNSGTKKCGATGDAFYILEQLGVASTPRYPALVPLLTEDITLPSVAGVRTMATVTFMTSRRDIACEYGELQLTSGAISGIPVLQASDKVAQALAAGEEVTAKADLFPGYDDEAFEALMEKTLHRAKPEGVQSVPLLSFLNGFHNSHINAMILKKMKLSETMPMKHITDSMLKSILLQYRRVMIPVSAVGSFEKAQATSGGVSLSFVDETMQVKRVRGLFLAGELLDVNGRCGGYNLQWAWTSGAIAGDAAAAYALS